MYAGGYRKNVTSIPKTNKSLKRNDFYTENYEEKDKYFHLSFDDTIQIFEDITNNRENYTSIFENSTLKWLRKLHEDTGVKVSFYVFNLDGEFSLSQCTTKFVKEFENNSEWMKFGFHSEKAGKRYDAENQLFITEDYNSTIRSLIEIVGQKSIDHIIRLEGFTGTWFGIKELTKNVTEPIVGLFGPDDGRKCYYLDEARSSYLYCHDSYFDAEMDLVFISTDLRAEYITNIEDKINEFKTDAWNNQRRIVEVFTHEWALNRCNRGKIKKICKWAKKNRYKYEFAEDIIEKLTDSIEKCGRVSDRG